MSEAYDLFGHHRQRAKGIAGEREVRRMLDVREIQYDWMGYEDQRYRHQRADILTNEYAIEVKRREKGGFLSEWWAQACFAAKHHGKRPAVAYRFDRNKWRIRVEVRTMNGCELIGDLALEDWADTLASDRPSGKTISPDVLSSVSRKRKTV